MKHKSRKGVSSRIAILGALVALLLLVSILGAIEYAQISDLHGQDIALSSTVASYSSDYSAQLSGYGANSTVLVQTWISHLAKLQSINGHFFNRSEALEDYIPNATMKWSGATMGMGGTYVGAATIGDVLPLFFGEATTLYISIDSFNVTSPSSGIGDIGAGLSFIGSAHIWGAFNGTVSAEYRYVIQNGSWSISQEDWSFETFNIQYFQLA